MFSMFIAKLTDLARRMVSIIRVVWHLLHGFIVVVFVFPRVSPARQHRRMRRWSGQMLRILRVRLEVAGVRPRRGEAAMLLANHVSWLDIFAILAVLPVRFVAKAEVRGWPLVGTLAARVGTLFLDRRRRQHTGAIGREIARALGRGEIVAVFPEGTTTDGSELLPFHASLLEGARIAGAALRPAAIRFTRRDGTLCREVAYDGDKSVLDTLWSIAAQPAIHAQVRFLPALAPGSGTRRELAREASVVIAGALGLPVPRTRSETVRDPRSAAR